jgi:glycosyltransferase involved in cell wall biosynthesis
MALEKNKELIDVVVPVYNSGPFLRKCLDSLLAQTFSSFKIWVVYDKSTDTTEQILNDYQSRVDRSKFEILYSPKKDGLGAARDFALNSKSLSGDYIIFPDSDDSVDPSYLQKLYTKATETGADLTFCGFDRIDEKTGKQISADMIHNGDSVICDLKSYRQLIYLNPSAWNKLYRRKLFNDIRFTNIKRAEDLFGFIKMVPSVSKIAFVNEILYHYLVRSGSLSNTFGLKELNTVIEGFLEAKRYYEENNKICSSFYNYIEAEAIIRVGIGSVTRVAICDKKDKRTAIDIAKKFLNSNFPNWKKNPYISFKNSRRNGFKSLALWLAKINFQTHCFGLFILSYKTFTKIFKKDIKW